MHWLSWEPICKPNFSEQFRKLINRYKRIGYTLDIMRQTACLAVNYVSLFNCTTAVQTSEWRPLRKTLTSRLGAWRYVFGFARRGWTIGFHLLWLAMSTRLCLSLWLIWFLCFRFDALTELGAFMRTEFLCISVLRAASGPRTKLASCKST